MTSQHNGISCNTCCHTKRILRCDECNKRISKENYHYRQHRELCTKHYVEMATELGLGYG